MTVNENLTAGELRNQFISDSVSLPDKPYFITDSSPTCCRGKLLTTQGFEISDYDTTAPDKLGFSQPRTQFPLDSYLMVQDYINKIKILECKKCLL